VFLLAKGRKLVFPWCASPSEKYADSVIFGVASERGSRAPRKGSSGGPRAARAAAEKFDLVKRGKSSSIMYTGSASGSLNCYDAGDIQKVKIEAFARRQVLNKRVIGCVGGDHSITYDILKGVDSCVGAWSFVYIDAHPDCIGSAGRYYGSVVHDILALKNVKPKSSLMIGVRAIEEEEKKGIEKAGIKFIGMDRIIEEGIVAVSKYARSMITDNVYVSVDLDSVDPAFAPGVSTPVPGGLTAREILYIASTIGKSVNLGFDVMELNPKYDAGGMTAHLASLIMMNMACAARKRRQPGP
jgi:agmatinase